MGEAIVFHLDGLKMEGLEIPLPTALYAYVDI
jgi:predicted RNase H-like HicB family nuclease